MVSLLMLSQCPPQTSHKNKLKGSCGSSCLIGATIATRLAARTRSSTTSPTPAQAGKAVLIQADVSSLPEIKRLVPEALGQLGQIDILVLNASREAAPHLKEGRYIIARSLIADRLRDLAGSRVVFFSSSLTIASAIAPNYLLYASTKGATEQLARVLAKELGPKGITINSVAPGPIDTDMFWKDKTEEQLAFIGELHPQKRLGQPDEVSSVVAFLVSEEANWGFVV
ncbi:hypothetical protein C8Q80DRAFT_1269181 [Daedaleopsis nitida]|nr:hypothetical protein C8Q80DRAFT_1269181 [Daedaleopsis nitida]